MATNHPDSEVLGTGILTKDGFVRCYRLGQLIPREKLDAQYESDLQRFKDHLARQEAARAAAEVKR